MIQRKPQNRLGNNGASEVKNHPWFKKIERRDGHPGSPAFNWDALYAQTLESPFIPPNEDNFDTKNINEEWKDLDDPEFKENLTNLRRGSVQELFNGYYYDH